jgi:hypothetical protein
MPAALTWQPDACSISCEHGETIEQARPGDWRARQEARVILAHAHRWRCECWHQLVNVERAAALEQATDDLRASRAKR